MLPPCGTSQLKPAGPGGGLSCLLLPENFTSCNYLTHSFFSSKDKWNFFFFFLFTGCYPTRAFWGHVHSSWCNLSPSEYPRKLHCVFPCMLFSAHLWNTFTVCVLSHSSGEDFKVVFRLQQNRSEVNGMCSPCFTTMCKIIFDFYFSDLQPELQIFFPGFCQREMLHCTLTALQKIQFQPHVSCLWKHQAQIPELLLEEGSKDTERKGWMYFKGKK